MALARVPSRLTSPLVRSSACASELAGCHDKPKSLRAAPQAHVDREQAASEDVCERNVFRVWMVDCTVVCSCPGGAQGRAGRGRRVKPLLDGKGEREDKGQRRPCVPSGPQDCAINHPSLRPSKLVGEAPGLIADTGVLDTGDRRCGEHGAGRQRLLCGQVATPPAVMQDRLGLRPHERWSDESLTSKSLKAGRCDARLDSEAGVNCERQRPWRDSSTHATTFGIGSPQAVFSQPQLAGTLAISGGSCEGSASLSASPFSPRAARISTIGSRSESGSASRSFCAFSRVVMTRILPLAPAYVPSGLQASRRDARCPVEVLRTSEGVPGSALLRSAPPAKCPDGGVPRHGVNGVCPSMGYQGVPSCAPLWSIRVVGAFNRARRPVVTRSGTFALLETNMISNPAASRLEARASVRTAPRSPRRGNGVPAAAEPPPPCTTADSCRPAPSPQPEVFGTPSSATFTGPGNLTPEAPAIVKPKPETRAQKLVKALKACRKDRKKKKRQACERAAHRAYGVKASAKRVSRRAHR